MKDIKKGDYIRTPYGIVKYVEDVMLFDCDCDKSFKKVDIEIHCDDYEFIVHDDEIIKSSPDIIDLIKVGDVIVGKDNHKFEVYAVGSDCVYINELKEFILVKDIKGIVTKEQFSQMECRIGE